MVMYLVINVNSGIRIKGLLRIQLGIKYRKKDICVQMKYIKENLLIIKSFERLLFVI